MAGSGGAEETVVPVQGESRWPMAIAVLAMMGLVLVPPYAEPGVPILVAAVMGVMLLALVIADPGKIDDRSKRVRRLSIALVAFLLLAALGSTVLLVYDLISGAEITNEPYPLLLAGGKVWLGNNVAFAFLYWQLRSRRPGGTRGRAAAVPGPRLPAGPRAGLAPPGWRPMFWDYLYVAFTTANAFSPTDTMPLTHWAKGAMATQALISFLIVGLVIARAVGIFGATS